MKLPVSWLRDFVDVSADPPEVAARLGACGFNVEGVEGDVIDFEITANRPDCLSVYGLAREASAAFSLPLKDPLAGAPPAPAGQAPMRVSVGDAGCGRYALAVATVTLGPSPSWLADRLNAAGVRPINNVVDVTNYVMIELGHPLHAFDADTLSGGEIRVRRARAGETLTTLDGQVRKLDETMLVIADHEHAVAIAGVMGGAPTEVSASTRRVALESAWFHPATIRSTSRKLGLKTEASARFERGADPTAPVRALRRALQLLAQIQAGAVTGGLTDVFPRPTDPRSLTLRRTRVARLLGQTVPDADIDRVLGRLGFKLAASPDGWQVEIPPYRPDVVREVDLIEEVGRHWGFDRIPATFPALRTPPRASVASVDQGRRLRRLLCGAGLQEAVTFTFIEHAWASSFSTSFVPIANPLSEKFATLRPSLLPGLVDSLAYNRRREAASVGLFEIGTVFSPAEGERTMLGWVMTGPREAHWRASGDAVDFSDAKGIGELVAAAWGVDVDVEPAPDAGWLRDGRRAQLTAAGRVIGTAGQLRAVRNVGDGDAIVGGEIDLDALFAMAGPAIRAIDPLPRHPSIVRDLSIFVADRLPAASVRATIRAHAPATLVAVREFDRYQGKGVPDGQVSLSLRLTFRDAERTLTDHEVQHAVDAIVSALVREHGAVLRGAAGAHPAE